jgi:hypothetical protein
LAGAGFLAFGQLMGGGGDTSRLTGTNITLGATARPTPLPPAARILTARA